MPAWDPTVQQVAEADTVWMPDLTSVATLNADGGLLDAAQLTSQATAAADSFEFGAGKFTPAIRALGTPCRFFYAPADGLLSGDQFTIEFWAKHPTLNWQAVGGETLFGLDTPTLFMSLDLTATGFGPLNWFVFPHAAGSAAKVSRAFSTTALDVAANVWASVAIVKYPNDTVRCYLNGVDIGGVSTFDIPQVITDDLNQSGLRFGGTVQGSGASGFWISDVRVSRTARTPGQTPTLKSLTGTLAIDTTDATALDFELGTLHGMVASTPVGEVSPVSAVMRTDKLIHVTPIKAGATDGTHPTLGASGNYSYDWQVVDRSLNLLHTHGQKAWISVDATPQILGGSVAPYSGAALTSGIASEAQYPSEVPNDNTAWVDIVGDLIAHIGTLSVEVFAYSVWNEPDGGSWAGTRAAFMSHYQRTANAIRAVDATTPIIGGEIVGIYGSTSTWVNDLVAKHVATGCPLDGFTYHDYSGDIRYVADARVLLDEVLVANGLAAGSIPLYLGEFGWNNRFLPAPGIDLDPRADYQQLRAHGAAYTTAHVCNLLTSTVDVRGLAYSHIAYNDPLDGGYAGMQLIGPNLEHWGPYNAMQGLQSVLGDQALALDADLPPGVHAYAGKDASTGRVGIALANYGWAARDRTVDITLAGLTGNRRVRRWLVDPTHSSRWDTFEDDPGGSVDQDLELMSDTNGDPSSLSVTVPKYGSVFLVLDRTSVPKLVKLDGTLTLLP